MKRTLGLAGMLLAGCAVGVAARDVVPPARAQGQTGPSYEYNVLTVANGTENDNEVLRKYGHEGWRLAAATQNGPFRTLYLERQMPPR
jgi:hypothetical protein